MTEKPCYIAWIRRNKTRAPNWGLMTEGPARRTRYDHDGNKLPKGLTHLIINYERYRSRAEAQRRCNQLKAKETDPRYDFVPFSAWKFDAMAKTCGIQPWTTRKEDLASIEFSRKLHGGDFEWKLGDEGGLSLVRAGEVVSRILAEK
jgi:hypothetical protein